ncbi:MAG: hypothetical protein B7X09_00210 [Acidiphilium sp. 21-66-27]|nr:MAG: hypothetical protein B7X09_00210 [Acidiphilium sp. 21-66-27]
MVPQAFILPSFLIGKLVLLRSSFSKRGSTEIEASNTMHCDLARRATIVGWINAAEQFGGAISGRLGAENVQLGSGTSRNAMASTEAVATSSAARPRH